MAGFQPDISSIVLLSYIDSRIIFPFICIYISFFNSFTYRSGCCIACIFICNAKKAPNMCPVKIVNACVHDLLIGKALIKFDVIMQVSFGIIFTKLLCQILCQGRNQTSTVLCTFTATQFLQRQLSALLLFFLYHIGLQTLLAAILFIKRFHSRL